MALVICPECNNKVSSKAQACPSCGCPGDIIWLENEDIVVGQALDAHMTDEDLCIEKIAIKKVILVLSSLLFKDLLC